MVILIGTQKGGAGKSTFTLMLANYLSGVKNYKLTVLDMDYQRSLFSRFEKDQVLENEPLYEVISVNLQDYPSVLKLLQTRKQELVIIDLPGKMDDDLLIPVIESADLIFSPFNYDQFSVDSTMLFALVTRRLNENAKMVFVPNRIKTNVRHYTKMDVDEALGKFGEVVPEISDRVDYQRMNTISIPQNLLAVISPVLDLIHDHYIFKA